MTENSPARQARERSRTKTPTKRTSRAKTQAPQPDPAEDEAQAAQLGPVEVTGPDGPEPDWAKLLEGGPPVMLSTYRPTVDEAWSHVMAAVPSIPKSDYNEAQGFHFRGVDATVDAIGKALRAHYVKVIPVRVKQIDAAEYMSKSGTRMVNRVVKVRWHVRGPRGDYFPGESMGEAADSGDKAMPKAMSVAYRTFLLQAIAAATGERDPDADSHERATPSEREQVVQQASSGRSYRSRQEWEDAQRQAKAGEENQDSQRWPESAKVDPWTGKPDEAKPNDTVRQPDSKAEPAQDNSAARKEMWRVAKDLGWEWGKLAGRFRSDYGIETAAATVQQIEEFKNAIIVEADDEAKREADAKALVQNELGGKEVTDDGPRF